MPIVRLKNAVTRQLEWDPEVDASAVGVTVRGAAVTLTGFIDTYAAKLAAERAAKRIHGVRAVANDIEVRLRLGRTDADIAQDAARVLEVQSTVPEGVQAAVHNGTVSLTGQRLLAVPEGGRRERSYGTSAACAKSSTTSPWRRRLRSVTSSGTSRRRCTATPTSMPIASR